MWLIPGTKELIQSVFCKSRRLSPVQNNMAGKANCIKHCPCHCTSVKGTDRPFKLELMKCLVSPLQCLVTVFWLRDR